MAALVLERFPEATFKIIGQDGPEKASLLELAAELGITACVEFTSQHYNVNAVYHTFDVFVLGSAHEGFANVIVEAMASGLPVVATRVGGAPEVIEEGITGFMVPPRNPELLAERVGRLLADPCLRETMGLAGYVRAARDFSLQSMVSRYEKLYAEIMALPSPVPATTCTTSTLDRTA
jgi:glycosyltransferase involved in cell wall biosynthesis